MTDCFEEIDYSRYVIPEEHRINGLGEISSEPSFQGRLSGLNSASTSELKRLVGYITMGEPGSLNGETVLHNLQGINFELNFADRARKYSEAVVDITHAYFSPENIMTILNALDTTGEALAVSGSSDDTTFVRFGIKNIGNIPEIRSETGGKAQKLLAIRQK